MKIQDPQLALEILEMNRQSRRQNALARLRSVALLGSGAAAGLFGFFTGGELVALIYAIVATAIVMNLQSKR